MATAVNSISIFAASVVEGFHPGALRIQKESSDIGYIKRDRANGTDFITAHMLHVNK